MCFDDSSSYWADSGTPVPDNRSRLKESPTSVVRTCTSPAKMDTEDISFLDFSPCWPKAVRLTNVNKKIIARFTVKDKASISFTQGMRRVVSSNKRCD